jgi:hypothetical protein
MWEELGRQLLMIAGMIGSVFLVHYLFPSFPVEARAMLAFAAMLGFGYGLSYLTDR